MSDQDISLGQKGIPEIENRLDAIDFGVVFVTRENKEAPWIHYETGALSRAVNNPDSRVIPMLVDLSVGDLGASPLSGYQGKQIDKEGVYRACCSINECAPQSLAENVLEETFEMWWPKLQSCWDDIDLPMDEGKVEVSLSSVANQIEELTKLVAALRNAERTQTKVLEYVVSAERNKLAHYSKRFLNERSIFDRYGDWENPTVRKALTLLSNEAEERTSQNPEEERDKPEGRK